MLLYVHLGAITVTLLASSHKLNRTLLNPLRKLLLRHLHHKSWEITDLLGKWSLAVRVWATGDGVVVVSCDAYV